MSTSTATAAHTSTGRQRSIAGVYQAPGFHWVGDGFRVAGYFSEVPDAFRKLSPFLLLDYHPSYDYAPTDRPRGVGVHPHRGFETVTIAWQGSVAHKDSSGGGGVIGPGDVQWMTAGAGILHQEFHEQSYAERGGPFQMAQIWVNLPKEHKRTTPRYQALLAEQMGEVSLPDGAGSVRVIAGEHRGTRGPAETFTPVSMLDVRLHAGGAESFAFPASHNVALLVMDGEVTVNGTRARKHDFVLLEHDGEHVRLEASAEAQVLILSGEPIDEPVVQYGPFVMNTHEEIEEAFADLRSGRFGRMRI